MPGSMVDSTKDSGSRYKGRLKNDTKANFAIIWKMRVLLDKIRSLLASSKEEGQDQIKMLEETDDLLSTIEGRVNNRIVFQPINDVLVEYLWSDAFEIEYDLSRIEYDMMDFREPVHLDDLESVLDKMDHALQLLSECVDHVFLRRRIHVLNIQYQAIIHMRKSRMMCSLEKLNRQKGQSGMDSPHLLSNVAQCQNPMQDSGFVKSGIHKRKKKDKELVSIQNLIFGSDKHDVVNKQTPLQLKEVIIKRFLEKGHDGIYVVPLTLKHISSEIVLSADDIYNDLTVQEQFDMRIWVNISNQFTAVNSTGSISNTIFELINSHVVNPDIHLPPVHSKEFKLWIRNSKFHQQNLDNHQTIISNGVAAKKFLLVLHDMSEDQTAQLEDLFEALKHGSKSSKIIVTARSSTLVDSLEDVNILVSNVVEEVYWRFFKSNAFYGVNTDDYPSLMNLGMDTVRLIRRYPLAMKMIGRMLNTNLNMVYWSVMFYNIKYILEEHRAASEQYQLLSLLKLCFDQLAAPVGMCFHYCCLFPKDWKYRPKELMNIWISEGIILPTKKKYTSRTGCATSITKSTMIDDSSEVESSIPDSSTAEQHSPEFSIQSQKQSHKSTVGSFEKQREKDGFVGLDQKGEATVSDNYIPPVGRQSIDDTAASKGQQSIENTIALTEKSIEDVCIGYFDDLCTRGFLQPLDDNSSYYVMHSFIHYLAEVVSRRMKFIRLDSSWQPKEISRFHHLSIRSTNLPMLGTIEIEPRSLRTFIVYGSLDPNASEILDTFLEKMCSIRTLDLAGCSMKRLPKFKYSIRHSLHYLGLCDTSIEALPEEFHQYLHLRVLNVEGCQLHSLPTEVIRLQNLRHITGPVSLISSIRWIGKLKNLQELKEFRVCIEDGYEIAQLGDLHSLRGSLSITNLEIMRTADEARKAVLHLKSHLLALKLEWCSTEVSLQESAIVLECLQPPRSIKEMEINAYTGPECPRWFTGSYLSNIKKITLRNCAGFILLPCFAKMPSLEVLALNSLPAVKRIIPESDFIGSHRFPSLVELVIDDLQSLEEWNEDDPCFPCLQRFTVRHCPKLTMFPPLSLDKVTNMHVEGVPLSSFRKMKSSFSGIQGTDISKVSPTEDVCLSSELSKTLVIRDCPNLSVFSIPCDSSNDFLVPLVQLEIIGCNQLEIIGGAVDTVEKLHIERCHKFIKLPDGQIMESLHTLHIDNVSRHAEPFLAGLPALKVLIIKDSPELESLHVLLESHHLSKTLKHVHLINCEALKSLPRNMEQLFALHSLRLQQCSKISRLPYLPNNLDELHISNCPLLQERCSEYSPDWDKISHIPYLSVDWE